MKIQCDLPELKESRIASPRNWRDFTRKCTKTRNSDADFYNTRAQYATRARRRPARELRSTQQNELCRAYFCQQGHMGYLRISEKSFVVYVHYSSDECSSIYVPAFAKLIETPVEGRFCRDTQMTPRPLGDLSPRSSLSNATLKLTRSTCGKSRLTSIFL